MITISGNWSGPPDNRPCSDEDEDESSNSSDGRLEPIDGVSLDSVEAVAKAIRSYKSAILETDEQSSERKELVKKLIKLQIRYQDIIDRQENPIDCFETRGHVFVAYSDKIPGAANARKIYCQMCGGGIWIYLQASQHCQECGYSVHTSCMQNIMRVCVAQKIRTQPDFIMSICPEKTLSSLKFRCSECDLKLSSTMILAEPRLCDYTGLSFCPRCHWKANSITPARVIHNWDFHEYPVSQASKQYLFLMFSKPVIHVEKENPKLFAAVQELSYVHFLRKNVMQMKKYLMVCRIAQQQKLLLYLKDRQHFIDGPDFYSLKDLVDTYKGILSDYLEEKLSLWTEHIRSCVLCLAKGFICELCNSDPNARKNSNNSFKVLFPFDNDAATCPRCFGVYHKDCFTNPADCPKCQRIEKRATGDDFLE